MDVFNHFSCYTKLPVMLEHVVEHILETGVVASINIYSLDMDPSILAGFCYVYVDKPHNSFNHHTRAWIGYSDKLTREMARLVICKELLHLLDKHGEIAQQREQVSQLIDEIILPPEVAKAIPAISDQAGILLALAVMMPECAIEEFRPRMGKSVSVETVAKHARLPEEYVRIAFSPVWMSILASMQTRYPKEGDAPLLDQLANGIDYSS